MQETKDRDLTNVSLIEYKDVKLSDIRKKTGQLISVGFTFDSKQFPADASSNFNYNVMKVSKADFTFPKNIGTLTGETYALAEIDVDAFWVAAKNFVEPILEGNRTLVNNVSLAIDKSGVDAVVDNR